MPPPHGTSAVHKLGSPPGRLPAPAPPHLHRAAPCSAPGRPQRSTGAPTGSSPRAATRSGPVRPGPASGEPPARPGPGPARPKWAVQRGGGSEGRPRPRGAFKRRHPVSRVSGEAHARRGYAAGLRFPPSEAPRLCVWRLGRLRTRRQRVTLYPYPSPGASGC